MISYWKEHTLTILRIWSFKCSFSLSQGKYFVASTFVVCVVTVAHIRGASVLIFLPLPAKEMVWFVKKGKKEKKKTGGRRKGKERKKKGKNIKKKVGFFLSTMSLWLSGKKCEWYKKILAIIVKQYKIWKGGNQGSFVSISALCSLFIRKVYRKEGKCTRTHI